MRALNFKLDDVFVSINELYFEYKVLPKIPDELVYQIISRSLPMFQVFMPVTCRERYDDTVKKPRKTLFPKVTTDGYLRQAATDLIDILKEPKRSIPTLIYGSPTINTCVHLEQILKQVATLVQKQSEYKKYSINSKGEYYRQHSYNQTITCYV